MNKKNMILVLMLAFYSFSYSQVHIKNSTKPKLVIGLVIDQMRWDYLERYQDLYISGGFKRLMNEGFNCNNTIIPYIPTYTGPGHTCIFTGSVPAFHGIVGNDWFERSINKNLYCTSDSTVSGVGSNSIWGKMSPKNLWATTVTDELRLSNNFQSKVIAISLKDRASILPGGHTANAAYWYDETVGGFITSTYYMNELPQWVSSFNKKDLPSHYMDQDWNLLLNGKKYIQSTSNNETFDGPTDDGSNKQFPHKLKDITNKRTDAFRYTPYANTYIFNFAESTIENEKLGGGRVTDFLTLSISSTDLIGHRYGPNSLEIEDTYLRLDQDIASFLTFLDNKLGKGNYTLFLSADHGVSNVPAFLTKNRIPAGTFSVNPILHELNTAIENKFQIKNAVQLIENSQVYLAPFPAMTLENKNELKTYIIQQLLKIPFILNAFTLDNLGGQSIAEPLKQSLVNGYNPLRSGDIQFIAKPFNIDYNSDKFGTTHGSWNLYDAHIPLIFFGWGINKGSSNQQYYMTDIAATVSSLLKIQMPDACVGKVINEVIKKN